VWLPLALASAAAGIAAWLLLRFHPTSSLPRPVWDTTWRWNRSARITLCLSMQGAPDTIGPGSADLNVDGILTGFGDISRASNPRDMGNVIDCDNYPQRYIEVKDRQHKTWRIMYDLPERQYPTVHAHVGSRVRFFFKAAFYAAPSATFVLSDEAGPVIGIETNGYGPGVLEGGDLSFSWGRAFGRRRTGCGGEYVARGLQVSGDEAVSIPPGQVGSVSLHGARFLFWNIHSINVVDGGCPHDSDWTSWVLWRQ
jgi:hypothetical protein